MPVWSYVTKLAIMSPISSEYFNEVFNGKYVLLDEGNGPIHSLVTSSDGKKLALGYTNGIVKLYDFNRWQCGGCGSVWSCHLEQSVECLAFSSDDNILAAGFGSIVSFISVDVGDVLVNSIKGDMYIRDPRQVNGHVARVTDLQSNTGKQTMFASSSIDGTVRIWDLTTHTSGVEMSMPSIKVHAQKSTRGARDLITCLSYVGVSRFSNDYLMAGSGTGTLLKWDSRTNAPSINRDKAHVGGIIELATVDAMKVVTRGEDDMISLWDIRVLKNSIASIEFPEPSFKCCIAVSPDFTHFVVTAGRKLYGTKNASNSGTEKNQNVKSGIGFFASDNLNKLGTLDLDGIPSRVAWGRDTNQLFVACHDGRVWVRCGDNDCDYAAMAHKTRQREMQKKKVEEAQNLVLTGGMEAYPADQLPPQFEETLMGGVKRVKQVNMLAQQHVPKKPPTEREIENSRIPEDEEDIVETLRNRQQKFAEEFKRRKMEEGADVPDDVYHTGLFMRAYAKTQPKFILEHDAELGQTREDKRLLGVSKCPKCGIKICQCGYMGSR